MATLLGVFPIGNSDPAALPVHDFGPAIAFYHAVLGFELIERTSDSAKMRRDEGEIVLRLGDTDPYNYSLYFSTDDVAAFRAEMIARLLEPTELRMDSYGGKQFRVFFVKEPYGVCFCIGQEISPT